MPQPPAGAGLPMAWAPGPARWWWVGAHGGSGASTLHAAVPGGAEAGRCWPLLPGARPRVVLVARSSASGLAAAQMAAAQWASGAVPVDLLGLAVVADAPGRLPGPLRDLVRLVGGGVPHLWRVPWSEDWRLGTVTPATTGTLVRTLSALITD
ncbi:DUF6668 family protein [Streptomyces albidoflavus]